MTHGTRIEIELIRTAGFLLEHATEELVSRPSVYLVYHPRQHAVSPPTSLDFKSNNEPEFDCAT